MKCFRCQGTGKFGMFQSTCNCNNGEREFKSEDFKRMDEEELACPYCGEALIDDDNIIPLDEDEEGNMACDKCGRLFEIECVSVIRRWDIRRIEGE